jgi:GNAT superfamily N-acetyltransferase
VGNLYDKPHRITWLVDEPLAVIRREPYATHPIAAVHAHWEHFRERWGFVPRRLSYGQHPLGTGQRWALLAAEPGWQGQPSEVDLLDAAVTLARTFGAKARVYPYDPRRRDTRDPIGWASIDGTLRQVLRCLNRQGKSRTSDATKGDPCA